MLIPLKEWEKATGECATTGTTQNKGESYWTVVFGFDDCTGWDN